MQKCKKGFTLLELLAVLVILSALATTAIAIYDNKSDQAKVSANATTIQQIQKLAESYEWEKPIDPDTFYGEIDTTHPMVQEGFLRDKPINPWE